MKYRKIYFAISGAVLLLSLVSLIMWQVKPSIDFKGGALLEVSFANNAEVSTDMLNAQISSIPDVQVNTIQVIGKNESYIIKLNSIDENKKNEVITKISEVYPDPTEVRFETVGPSLGRELLIKTATAAILASIFILMYIAYQFKDKIYGIAAILAMFHDTFILVGAFSLFGHFMGVEVDVLFVTALLTTLSFSVHDTIVVFDRIREKRRARPHEKFEDAINNSITETLPRSLNNSLTIIFMLTALVLLGGITIKWFAAGLLVGTVVGTYSSTFVAAPLLLVFTNKFRKETK